MAKVLHDQNPDIAKAFANYIENKLKNKNVEIIFDGQSIDEELKDDG